MTTNVNRQWLLAARPVGMVKDSDFEYRESELPKPKDGEILVRALYLAFEPAMRGWMMDRPSYIPPVGIGEVMRGFGVGRVIESKAEGFKAGDHVHGGFGWQEYCVTGSGGRMPPRKLPPGIPLTPSLGVLGLNGLTAYFGLLDLGKPVEGETVVVSGAAGATGSVAAQIAKLESCRVIGIAGGPEKCGWLVEEAGLDAAIDYKSDDVAQRLDALCPDGVDVYFDNVGGDTLDAVLVHAYALNGDSLGELLGWLQGRDYRFIPLEEALEHPAYASEDRYEGPAGITWLHRWAITRNMPKSIFAGEPAAPDWIQRDD